MIAFQLLLTAFMGTVIIYGAGASEGPRSLRLLLITAGLVCIAVVWQPNWTTHVASWFGIGRGSDLVFYLWIVISFGLIVRLSIQLLKQQVDLTKLARNIALRDAADDVAPWHDGSAEADDGTAR